ncbi:histidine kinase, partial [Escherichia coli]|nr:histidine kinase [Escherichia coli]
PRARRFKAPASLGAKLVLILTGVGIIGAAALTLMISTVITPSFNQLERDAVDAHVARTQAVVHDVVAKVENAVRDY